MQGAERKQLTSKRIFCGTVRMIILCGRYNHGIAAGSAFLPLSRRPASSSGHGGSSRAASRIPCLTVLRRDRSARGASGAAMGQDQARGAIANFINRAFGWVSLRGAARSDTRSRTRGTRLAIGLRGRVYLPQRESWRHKSLRCHIAWVNGSQQPQFEHWHQRVKSTQESVAGTSACTRAFHLGPRSRRPLPRGHRRVGGGVVLGWQLT